MILLARRIAMRLDEIINFEAHAITDTAFQVESSKLLDETGVLVLRDFLRPAALESVCSEGERKQHLAYYTRQNHNVYISDNDPAYGADHVRNRAVTSSKGCITDDQIGRSSALKVLYDSDDFRAFLCAVLGEKALYAYADDCSSINLHYAGEGQELGWHFDNSSFATTLLIQKPEAGGVFEYVRDMREAETGEMNFDGVEKVLSGETIPDTLSAEAGALALFRGRNAIHRVTPTEGSITRMLVVFAYNNQPGVALSASARKTFYGR
jgi:hypothetical protein